ncbi:MAG TPA: hypothetical protein VHV30_03180 [Polyangiaceae bacterium]|nr:hypothetical protein [Polyangiaceae bacterium]
MIALAFAPLLLQAAAMVFDEFHFHRRRGLPLWERVGHPLDTCTVLACFAVALVAPADGGWRIAYGSLAAFSCLFITKDEPVHARACTPGEQWLHAVLFVLHPIVLACVALFWVRGARGIVAGQAALTFAFGVYQVVYWNLWRTSWWRSPTRAR